MKELITRLEKATGPDRELDRDIELVVGNFRYPKWEKHPTHGNLLRHIELDDWVPAVKYTSSLDAALTLVPEGWWLAAFNECRTSIIYKDDQHLPEGRYIAGLQHVKGGRYTSAYGVTPAIALCLAALKAREH